MGKFTKLEEEDFLNNISFNGMLRKLMSKEEIRMANRLVKEGKLNKGVSDDKQGTVCFFIK